MAKRDGETFLLSELYRVNAQIEGQIGNRKQGLQLYQLGLDSAVKQGAHHLALKIGVPYAQALAEHEQTEQAGHVLTGVLKLNQGNSSSKLVLQAHDLLDRNFVSQEVDGFS